MCVSTEDAVLEVVLLTVGEGSDAEKHTCVIHLNTCRLLFFFFSCQRSRKILQVFLSPKVKPSGSVTAEIKQCVCSCCYCVSGGRGGSL